MEQYKSFTIRGAPEQLAESGRWTTKVFIDHWEGGEMTGVSFNVPETWPSREEAMRSCLEHGRRIIDAKVEGVSVGEVEGEPNE